MKNTIATLLVLLSFFACKQQTASTIDTAFIDDEIAQLQTEEQLKTYWEAVYDDDQKYRREESLILQRFGHDSGEYQDIKQKMNETDALNIVKVEKLLAKFGYPKASKLSAKAASAPYTVIHHSNDYNIRKRNFQPLYEAYKSGELKEGPFSFYLNRTYELKTGERYEVGAVFKEEDRINGIIAALGLAD